MPDVIRSVPPVDMPPISPGGIVPLFENRLMANSPALPSTFWTSVAEHVTAKIEPVLGGSASARRPVIAYLRDLETVARRESDSRQAIQVIASGRRVLGDHVNVGLKDGPFSRT